MTLPPGGAVTSPKALGPHIAPTTRFRVKGNGRPMKGLALIKEIFEGLVPMAQVGASVAF